MKVLIQWWDTVVEVPDNFLELSSFDQFNILRKCRGIPMLSTAREATAEEIADDMSDSDRERHG